METFLIDHGYLTLFILSFLASTIIPLGSEWFLLALLAGDHSPVLSVALATAGNTLGACTTYAIGLYGGPLLVGRVLRISDESRRRAERIYSRYGFWSLLFSWLPIIGDPLCLVGGIFKLRFDRFVALVLAGKLSRYVIIGLIAVKVLEGSR